MVFVFYHKTGAAAYQLYLINKTVDPLAAFPGTKNLTFRMGGANKFFSAGSTCALYPVRIGMVSKSKTMIGPGDGVQKIRASGNVYVFAGTAIGTGNKNSIEIRYGYGARPV
jgi:hypothetical protein